MLNWKKPATILVLIFIIVFVVMRCQEANAETTFELLPNTVFIGGKHHIGTGLVATERFANKYDVGILLLTEQQCRCERDDFVGNLGVHAQRIVQWKLLELGLGIAYWQNQSTAWSSNTTFALHWGLNFGNWTLKHRHYSTGGASEQNAGLDMLTIGYAFQ